MSTQHDDHEDTVQQGEIDLVHDQDLVISEARLALDVGLTRQFSASVVLPARLVSTKIRYLAKADGSEVDLVMPGVHHRNETLTGIGDPMLLGAFTTPIGPARVVVRGGLTLPLGETEDNPFTADAETMPHQHVQMGTGTFRPVIAADVSIPHGPWRFGAFLFTQQSVYTNDRGYKSGDRYATGLAVSRALGTRWSVRGGAEVQGETAEHWNGVEHTDDGNRGRIDAMFAAGASYVATDRLAIDATIKIPFVTHAVGGQLDMPAIVEVGAAWRFGAIAKPRAHSHEGHDHEHEDEHEHEHGEHEHDEHDEHVESPVAVEPPATEPPPVEAPVVVEPPPTEPKPTEPKPVVKTVPKPRPDIAAYNKPGEAPDLVPVKGKLTIFDFWATWCEPCKKLDPVLAELARKYPDVVALRKLDVVDWDSKAAERYLTPGGFDLPHLKIYDASGKRVLEKSSAVGKLQELIDQTRALVEAAAKAKQ